MRTGTWLLSMTATTALAAALLVWQPVWAIPIPVAVVLVIAIALVSERIAAWAMRDS